MTRSCLRFGVQAGRTCLCVLLVLAPLGIAPVRAQEAGPTGQFHLDLDTGGHRAMVKDLVFTPDGDLLLSASDDKSIRVWDWRSGVTIRTLRGQIGPGNEGKVFAIDVSPDGDTVAAGGWFGAGIGDAPPYGDIRLFDLSSGRIEHVLKGHDYAVYDLDFSPDGAFLAAGGQGGYVHVWRREGDGWAAHGVLDANAERIERVAFALGGERIVVATADFGLRLFDMASGEAIALPEATALEETPLTALAVSPDGATFSTGTSDGQVQVWDAADGSLAATMPALGHLVGALAYSPDGSRLMASCGYRCGGDNDVVSWTLAEPGSAPVAFTGHDNTVVAAATSAAAGLVATAGGERHQIRLWDAATGEERAVLVGAAGPVTAVGIDGGGSAIAWGEANPCPREVACPDRLGALVQVLPLPTDDFGFEDPAPIGDRGGDFARAVVDDGRWRLSFAEGGAARIPNAVLEILDGGRVVHRIENDDTSGTLHGSYTLLSDGRQLITGGADGTMIAYDRETGTQTGEFFGGHTGEVLAMAEARDARLLVTGGADQTLRLWNLETRALVASALFVGDEWVVWTPQGYFHSSPNGDDRVGWHVNQGQDSEARYVKARQLRQHLNSPEIVRRAILTGDPAGAARELRGTDGQLDQLLRRRPPEFEIRVVEDAQTAEGFVAIEIVGAAEAGAEVGDFSIVSNDRRVESFAARAADGPDGDGRIIVEVPVNDGENEILVTGVNEFGYVTERGVRALAKKTAEAPKGKLYVVAVGVNEYPHLTQDCSGRPCDLRFPVADATGFMSVVAERTAPLHAEMQAMLIVNEDALYEDADAADALVRIVGEDRVFEPDSRTIRDEIIDFLDLPGPDDTTMVFIAGHGINIDEDYYVIPSDGRKQDGDRWRRSSLVAWADIHEAVERANGRRIVLLDTCHAANAFNARLEKEAADARIIVLAATAANNTAAELSELGHGVFTHAVLDGMRGKANTGGDGVRILGLSDFIDREVRRLTNSRQEPFYHLPRTENFLLAQP